MFALLGYMPGPFELIVLAVIVLLLFGHRLPSIMRSLGRGVVEFKRGVQGIEDETDETKSKDSGADSSHQAAK